MGLSDSRLTPDLDGTGCCAADCLDAADTVGTATLGVPLEVGIDGPIVLAVPLCIEHAHLLRMGVTDCRLDSGIW